MRSIRCCPRAAPHPTLAAPHTSFAAILGSSRPMAPTASTTAWCPRPEAYEDTVEWRETGFRWQILRMGGMELVDCNSWLAFKFSGALRLGSGRTDKTNSVRGEVLEP